MEDKGKVLREERPFSYKITKEGKGIIYWRNRQVLIIKGKELAELKAREQEGDAYGIQLFLAKITGHFKHGNER